MDNNDVFEENATDVFSGENDTDTSSGENSDFDEPIIETADIDEAEPLSSIEDELKKVKEAIKQRDYSASGSFLERSTNIVKNARKTVEKLSDMAKDYSQVPMKWAKKKAEITSEKEEVINATLEERQAMMGTAKASLKDQLQAIEDDPKLSDEEKAQKKAEKEAEFEELRFLIEDYPNLSMKEQDKIIDEQLEAIDKEIHEEQERIKKQMAHVMMMQMLLLQRYLKKGYDPKEIYEGLKVLAEIELDDKQLEKYLRDTFDETLLRNSELQRIYIAYSEKKGLEEAEKTYEKNSKKSAVDAIEELLNVAEENLDRNALDEACNLISNLPNGDDKNDLQARAAEIDELIKKNDKDKDLSSDDIDNKNNGNDTDLGDDLDQHLPEIPNIECNSPKKTWKTWLALAAGIGVGAAVFFTCGTVGVSVMAIAGGITKRLIAKRRKTLEMQRLNGELQIEGVEEPLPGIKGKIQKLKEYFKSEEFCRDATWFLNGAIYTGLGLNVASSIYNMASAHLNPADVTPTNSAPANPTTTPQTLDPTQISNPSPVEADPMSGIRIGDNVGEYNVSVGHDTAGWATGGTNTENLISEYVNGDSIFKRFAVMNPDGSIGQIIDTNGLSITDFCNEVGIDPSQIAVDVANKSGTSQAWVSTSELLKGVGGKTL